MKILSIETSCDDTGIAILEVKGGEKNPTFKILAEGISSQIKIHAPYGGVFPALAKREHIKNLPILLEKILKKAKLEKNKKPVDMIAVTYGPGLEPALWTGIVFAKELSKKWDVPLLPVNHMEGHTLSVFGKNSGSFKIPKIEFPILSLLVSGGHTELVLAKDWMKYKTIGETVDDAAGEAFDKVARMMGLPYPGGPEISRLAEVSRISNLKRLGSATARARGIFQQKNIRTLQNTNSAEIYLPRPMMYTKNYDFSFSGLKTAVLYLIRDLEKEHPDKLQFVGMKESIAREFEDAVVDVLTYKTLKAIKEHKVKTLIVGGGVSANKRLKKILTQKIKAENPKIKVLFPGKKLSMDNAVMIALVGYFRRNKATKKGFDKIKAVGGLSL
ncbi:MAG: tRNA (adenosine(37)-N6)-threonylcarbamoyltransferase complex transferase subunit TsaD [Candidatus Nomurabacteria bacterium]|nr:tRNA (adenosine(37)-N6)-threonylcarbamoyltransferase complex transferase subunit TsaD [Candidatus Nomurabacteria bacterium]